MLLYGTLIIQYDYEASGRDDTDLGRWMYMVLWRDHGVNTKIVCGYNPYENGKKIKVKLSIE